MSVEPLNQVTACNESGLSENLTKLQIPTVNLFKSLNTFLKRKKQQRIDRDAFKNLLSLDDRSLADIGVTREDVMWASNLPLSTNAALELKALKGSKKDRV
ncbi:MAG: DUF1127 domain-containing protein [Pseudomonadota bacterium]